MCQVVPVGRHRQHWILKVEAAAADETSWTLTFNSFTAQESIQRGSPFRIPTSGEVIWTRYGMTLLHIITWLHIHQFSCGPPE